MDAIRTLSGRLAQRSADRSTHHTDEILHSLTLSRIGIATVVVIGLLAFYMYLRQASALQTAQEREQQALQRERDRLELLVRERTASLTELANHLQQVREDERGHLARELHDELGALLTAAKLDVARLKSKIDAQSPEIAERLKHPHRNPEQRHRPQAQDHRRPPAFVPFQPGAHRIAGDPGARIRAAQQRGGGTQPRAGGTAGGCAAHDLPDGAGVADQHRQSTPMPPRCWWPCTTIPPMWRYRSATTAPASTPARCTPPPTGSWVCATASRAAGGRLTVTSEANEGTLVSAVLPVVH